MNPVSIHAVLTGDLVGSQQYGGEARLALLHALDKAFATVHEVLDDTRAEDFQVVRGDSFQGVVKPPGKALLAATLIRASLGSPAPWKRGKVDARIGIGLGSLESWADTRTPGRSAGEAFVLSGGRLDAMMNERSKQNALRLRKRGRMDLAAHEHPGIEGELRVLVHLIDHVLQKWTRQQCELFVHWVVARAGGEARQGELARRLGVTQGAISQRLSNAGIDVVWEACERFESVTAGGSER